MNVVIYSGDGITPEMVLEMLPDSIQEDPVYLMKLDSAMSHTSTPESGMRWVDHIIFDVHGHGQSRSFRINPSVLLPFPDDQTSLTSPTFIDYGIDPDETKKWKAGTISIRVGAPFIERNDTIWSDTLSIRVMDPAINRLKDYSNEQLVYTGNYWLRRGMCDEADLFAEELLKRERTAYQTVLLKAEVYRCQNAFQEALEMVHKALEAFNEQADPDMHPPEYLYDLIMILQDSLQMLKPK